MSCGPIFFLPRPKATVSWLLSSELRAVVHPRSARLTVARRRKTVNLLRRGDDMKAKPILTDSRLVNAFCSGLDTVAIAARFGLTECDVYNRLARLTERRCGLRSFRMKAR